MKSSQPAFSEPRQRPVIFGDELLDDAAAFQVRRQHFPGVGFHFQMRTELRIFREQIENAEQMVVGVGKRRRGGRVERDMEMDAPLGRELRVES